MCGPGSQRPQAIGDGNRRFAHALLKTVVVDIEVVAFFFVHALHSLSVVTAGGVTAPSTPFCFVAPLPARKEPSAADPSPHPAAPHPPAPHRRVPAVAERSRDLLRALRHHPHGARGSSVGGPQRLADEAGGLGGAAVANEAGFSHLEVGRLCEPQGKT